MTRSHSVVVEQVDRPAAGDAGRVDDAVDPAEPWTAWSPPRRPPAASVTSAATDRRSRVSSPSSGRREVDRDHEAPSVSSRRAVAAPMPEAAPVTMTVLRSRPCMRFPLLRRLEQLDTDCSVVQGDRVGCRGDHRGRGADHRRCGPLREPRRPSSLLDGRRRGRRRAVPWHRLQPLRGPGPLGRRGAGGAGRPVRRRAAGSTSCAGARSPARSARPRCSSTGTRTTAASRSAIPTSTSTSSPCC